MPGKKRKKVYERLSKTSEEDKITWLEWFRSKEEDGFLSSEIMDMLIAMPQAPAPRTLYRWLYQEQNHDLAPHPPSAGRPPLLSATEEKVVIGKAYDRIQKQKTVSGQYLVNFVREAFNIPVSLSLISRLMTCYGFSSHRTRVGKEKQRHQHYFTAIHTFLVDVRERISHLPHPSKPSRLVCIDETSFWESSTILRSYALVNGGQPGVIQPDRKHKDLLVTGLVGDGTVLPPVIFTDDHNLAEMHFNNAFVLLVESSKGPSRETITRWFDVVRDWLEDEPLLLLDNVRCHHNPDFLREVRETGVQIVFYPEYAGCLVDPCDNSFHSVLKRLYLGKDRSTHENCIRSMIQSYYEVKEESILRFFERCGYTSSMTPAQVTRQLLSQGYDVHAGKTKELRKCVDIYYGWKQLFRDVISDTRTPVEPIALDSATLDGTYWNVYEP